MLYRTAEEASSRFDIFDYSQYNYDIARKGRTRYEKYEKNPDSSSGMLSFLMQFDFCRGHGLQ